MTSQSRLERELPEIFADMAVGSPDYLDDVFAQTAAIGQRPAWTFPERWIPVSALTARLIAAPPTRWRTIGVMALLIIAIAAAAILVAGSRQQRLPAPFGPAANGPIVYSSQGDIYVRDTLTSEPRLIVGGPDKDAIAGYSRDGTRMAFFRQVDQLDDLWVAGADGSNPARVAGPFDRVAEQAPWDIFDWSPSGDAIAVSYTSHEAGTSDTGVIDVVRTDGSGSTRVALDMATVDPAWRPGGDGQLAFRGLGPEGWAVFLWKTGGSAPLQLDLDHERLIDGEGDFKNLAWAPDGRRLAYTTVDAVPCASGAEPCVLDDGWYRLHVATIGPDGAVLDQRRASASTTLEHEFGPAWLPAGDQLVFQVAPNGEDRVHVMVAPTTGGASRELGLVGDGYVLGVAPDGSSVLALEHATSHVFVVDLATGAITKGFKADWSTTLPPTMRRLAP